LIAFARAGGRTVGAKQSGGQRERWCGEPITDVIVAAIRETAAQQIAATVLTCGPNGPFRTHVEIS
jgi:hypothetical protein